MRIMLINGPNINMIGTREPEIYGEKNYENLKDVVSKKAKDLDISIKVVQSNHEGMIIDSIQEAFFDSFNGIIINPGGYTHTSIAIMDAILASNLPTVEVHLSNINKREEFRQVSMIAKACIAQITGFGQEGYLLALEGLVKHIKTNKMS